MIDLHYISYVINRLSDSKEPIKVFDAWISKKQFRVLISSYQTKEYIISSHQKYMKYKFFYDEFIVYVEVYFVNDNDLPF